VTEKPAFYFSSLTMNDSGYRLLNDVSVTAIEGSASSFAKQSLEKIVAECR
jgi:hypothetical protein